jgi:hypothetical protein
MQTRFHRGERLGSLPDSRRFGNLVEESFLSFSDRQNAEDRGTASCPPIRSITPMLHHSNTPFLAPPHTFRTLSAHFEIHNPQCLQGSSHIHTLQRGDLPPMARPCPSGPSHSGPSTINSQLSTRRMRQWAVKNSISTAKNRQKPPRSDLSEKTRRILCPKVPKSAPLGSSSCLRFTGFVLLLTSASAKPLPGMRRQAVCSPPARKCLSHTPVHIRSAGTCLHGALRLEMPSAVQFRDSGRDVNGVRALSAMG